MMILSNSWAQHIRDASTKDANANMKAITDALKPGLTLEQRINALTKDIDMTILIAGQNTIVQSHSWSRFGGTRSMPNLMVTCLIKMGPRAIAIIVNHYQATEYTWVRTPSKTKTTTCKKIQELEELVREIASASAPNTNAAEPTAGENTTQTNQEGETADTETTGDEPTATGRGRRRPSTTATMATQRRGNTSGNTQPRPTQCTKLVENKITPTFIMAPFLCNAILSETSTNPLHLIVSMREAAVFFDTNHWGQPAFANVSAKDHAATFATWAFTVHAGQVTKVCQTIAPDNTELQNYSNRCHKTCIHGQVNKPQSDPEQRNNNMEVFKHLSEGLKRMGEATLSQKGRDIFEREGRGKGERQNQGHAPVNLSHDLNGLHHHGRPHWRILRFIQGFL